MQNILITGANGFVGKALSKELIKRGYPARLGIRRIENVVEDAGSAGLYIPTGEIGPDTNWTHTLNGMDCVIHLAARAYVMGDLAGDPLAEFRRINTAGTARLATCAAQAGVKRLVFVSSVKVNGEETIETPFTENDPAQPRDPYAISKWEAEQALARIAKDSGLEVVILRSPLIYGPRVKGNFRSMMSWLNKGYPLPLGAVHNLRSLVALDNLVDLIIRCIHLPAVVNETFLVSDGEDVSTTELLLRLGRALGKPAHLLPIPTRFVEIGAAMLGKSDLARRLCGSLQVNISHTRSTLGWTPPVSMDEALKRTADEFLSTAQQNRKR